MDKQNPMKIILYMLHFHQELQQKLFNPVQFYKPLGNESDKYPSIMK